MHQISKQQISNQAQQSTDDSCCGLGKIATINGTRIYLVSTNMGTIKQSWCGTSSSTYEKPQLQEDQTWNLKLTRRSGSVAWRTHSKKTLVPRELRRQWSIDKSHLRRENNNVHLRSTCCPNCSGSFRWWYQGVEVRIEKEFWK